MIIPFAAQLDSHQNKRWITTLNHQFNKYSNQQITITVVEFNQLTQQQLEHATIAIIANPHPDEIKQLTNLIWCQSLWAGVEGIVEQFKNSPVNIARLIDPVLANTMAEAVLTWTLYLHRHIPHYTKQQQLKNWQPIDVIPAPQTTVAVLGLGELGLKSTQVLLQQQFKVIGWSKNKKHIKGVTCFAKNQLHDCLKIADIIICLVPHTNDTFHMLSQSEFDLLKPTAQIINFSRAAIIDQQALVKHLNNHPKSHAVLDVFNQEPLPKKDPIWEQQGVTILPHISAPTNIQSASIIVTKQISNYVYLNQPPKFVDKKQGY